MCFIASNQIGFLSDTACGAVWVMAFFVPMRVQELYAVGLHVFLFCWKYSFEAVHWVGLVGWSTEHGLVSLSRSVEYFCPLVPYIVYYLTSHHSLPLFLIQLLLLCHLVLSFLSSVKGYFGMLAMRPFYLLPQSQMNSWIPFVCLCVQFEGSCELVLAQLLTSLSIMTGSLQLAH
jgi:hypothetical protein